MDMYSGGSFWSEFVAVVIVLTFLAAFIRELISIMESEK